LIIKLRIGFVTNSSSTCYTIAIRDSEIDINNEIPNNLKSALNIYNNIVQMIKDNSDVFKTVNDLRDYYCVEDIDEMPEKYLKCINNGYTVMSFHVPYEYDSSGVTMSNLLTNICDGNDIILLECD